MKNYDTKHFLEFFKTNTQCIFYEIDMVCPIKFPCLLTDYMKACLCIYLSNIMSMNKSPEANVVVSKHPHSNVKPQRISAYHDFFSNKTILKLMGEKADFVCSILDESIVLINPQKCK